MKNIKFIIAIIAAIFFVSCEDVISVDLDTAEPRLVVDASLDWIEGTDGSNQTIKLTTTTGYYEQEIPAASGATVFVTNSSNTVFSFIETPNTGIYTCTNFEPLINEQYELTIIYNGETYTATEKLLAAPQVTSIEQENETGFEGDEIEVRFFFPDNPDIDNFYLIRYNVEDLLAFPDYDTFDDRFFQGNDNFGIFSDEDLQPGDVVTMKLYNISERYYNYMSILLTVSGSDAGGGPFQVPPATVRGNLINQTNIDNYALGYFRVTAVTTTQYTVQ